MTEINFDTKIIAYFYQKVKGDYMEERKLKIMFANDGKGRYTHKLSVPKTWLEKMGVSIENREVIVSFNEETKEIIIKKSINEPQS